MAGIFSAVTAAAKVIETVNKAVKDPSVDNIDAVLNKIHNGTNGNALAESKGSITRFLGAYTVEPVIIASKGAKEEEIFERIVGMCTDIFCSFYLQAFEVLTSIGGYSAGYAIDKLSTDRGDMFSYTQTGVMDTVRDVQRTVDAVNTARNLSWNSYERDRPLDSGLNYMQALMSDNPLLSLSINVESKDKDMRDKKEIGLREGATDTRQYTDSLYAANFRQLKISIDTKYTQPGKFNGQTKLPDTKVHRTIVIPIQVRAHVIVTDINDIANSLTPRATDKSFLNRFMEWRSGGIDFFKDLIWCDDIIKEYKANRIKDKQDLLGRLLRKEISAGSKSGHEGFEKHYNMIVVTKEDKFILDKAIRGDIGNEKYKQHFLSSILGLGLVILDRDYERAEISIKDIRGQSVTSYKNITRTKGDDNNYEKIMQALLMNRPMAF